ncbi:MAG: NusG domain II-containing protein [Pseudomonadota bacterium]
MLTRTDRWIIALAVCGIASLYILLWRPNTEGRRAEISVNGKVVATLDLQRDVLQKFTGMLGESEIEIRDRRIRFRASPCHGKQCIHMGWARRGGEFIACLPNRIAVTIIADESVYDAVNF